MNSQNLSQWHASPSQAALSLQTAPPTGQQVFNNRGYGDILIQTSTAAMMVHLDSLLDKICITLEANLWAYPWWLIYIRLTEKERPITNVGGTIPWPRVPHRTQRRKQANYKHPLLSVSWVLKQLHKLPWAPMIMTSLPEETIPSSYSLGNSFFILTHPAPMFVCLFLNNPLSWISVACTCMGVRLFAGSWATYKWLTLRTH